MSSTYIAAIWACNLFSARFVKKSLLLFCPGSQEDCHISSYLVPTLCSSALWLGRHPWGDSQANLALCWRHSALLPIEARQGRNPLLITHTWPQNPMCRSPLPNKSFLKESLVNASMMQGKSLQQCGQKIKENYKPAFIMGSFFWPTANLINFRYIAPHQRILYVSCAGLVWNTFIR